MSRRWTGIALGVALLLLVSACSSDKAAPEFVYGAADVLRIQVAASATPAPVVTVTITGVLHDGCTVLDSVRQSLQRRSFVVTVTTRRPVEAACEQVGVPFEQEIPLVIHGLRPGEYSVVCGNVRAAFRIDVGDEVTPL